MIRLGLGALLLALLMHVVGGKRHILHLDVVVDLFLLLRLVLYYALLVDGWAGYDRGGSDGGGIGNADVGMAGLQRGRLARGGRLGVLSVG